MQLFVNTPLTRTLSFQAEPFTTIEEIKKKTQEREGIPIECQRLVYATKQLNDQNTLADYNISKDSTLFLLLRLKGGMQIQIKTTTGRTLTLDVDPSETLRTVKQKVAVKEGIPPEYQRLVFCSGSGSNTDNNNNNDNSENFLNYTNQEEQDQPIGQQVFRRGKKRRRTNDGNYVESENDSSFSFTLHTQPQPSLQDFQDLHDKKQQNNQQLQQQQQQEQQFERVSPSPSLSPTNPELNSNSLFDIDQYYPVDDFYSLSGSTAIPLNDNNNNNTQNYNTEELSWLTQNNTDMGKQMYPTLPSEASTAGALLNTPYETFLQQANDAGIPTSDLENCDKNELLRKLLIQQSVQAKEMTELKGLVQQLHSMVLFRGNNNST